MACGPGGLGGGGWIPEGGGGGVDPRGEGVTPCLQV